MFKKKTNKNNLPSLVTDSDNNNVKKQNNTNSSVPAYNPTTPTSPIQPSMLQFHCQLAHGSPTAFVAGFSNVRELYQKIAEVFDLPASEILFCTLNTYKPDMTKLLGAQIGLEDLIFAHKKGRPKEVELVKTEDALGLTITDNGAGYAFIKRIKEGSVISNLTMIQVGDHIEKLNGENMVNKKHFEVARFLKEIPKGSTFTIRLVEPLRSGFNNIAPKATKTSKKGYGSGKETLRFKAGGQAEIRAQDDEMDSGIEKINNILESFLGISDSDLATQIWDVAEGQKNSMSFAEAIDSSDLEELGFTDDLIIELWGAITDARDGRLKNTF